MSDATGSGGIMIGLLAMAAAMSVYQGAGGMAAKCKSTDMPTLAQCLAYMAGVNDAIASEASSDKPPLYCIPEKEPRIALAVAYTRYYDKVPGLAGFPAGPVAIGALENAFPCPK